MKFSEIPYSRVDMKKWEEIIRANVERFVSAKSFEEADTAYRDAARSDVEYTSNVSVARIRHDINMNDEFYAEEVSFYNSEMPKLRPVMNEWTKATLQSPFRKELEEKYGKVVFANAELAAKAFNPEIVEDIRRENELTNRYFKLIASALIPFKGKDYTISQLIAWKINHDDKSRLEAWKAEGTWYNEHGEELDGIFDELVKLRTSMAKKLGFENFKTLGYMRMNRNCYTEEDVKRFRDAVKKYLVPLANKLYKEQAKNQGRDFPLTFADKDLYFKSGNPVPVGTPNDILKTVDRFFSELSEKTNEFWSFVRENEMLDVESKVGKRVGAYCTRIQNIKSPFIFTNFNGTDNDIKNITHEAGHAFASYINRDKIPNSAIWPTMEGCETHSMTMEFFSHPWVEQFFGKDADKFRYSHLKSAIVFIPYGTMVDHFQHIIYEHPEYTPAQRHQVWAELSGEYMPWVKLEEIPFYSQGKGWQRQIHIYKSPFYYIDYSLAQTMSLQFWTEMQQDFDAAFEKYCKFTSFGGTKFFTELIELSELSSPFNEETIKNVSEAAEKYLDGFDLSEF